MVQVFCWLARHICIQFYFLLLYPRSGAFWREAGCTLDKENNLFHSHSPSTISSEWPLCLSPRCTSLDCRGKPEQLDRTHTDTLHTGKKSSKIRCKSFIFWQNYRIAFVCDQGLYFIISELGDQHPHRTCVGPCTPECPNTVWNRALHSGPNLNKTSTLIVFIEAV